MSIITDVRIQSITPLISPAALRTLLQLDDDAAQKILANRQQIDRIISREDPRILGIVGPCSIHDKKAALEYARRLKGLADRVSDRMLLIMRTYFEKPRTILGWRGLILDPYLDGTYDIAYGLELARDILLQISTLGLPVGCEMLDPIVPQYIDDIICLGCDRRTDDRESDAPEPRKRSVSPGRLQEQYQRESEQCDQCRQIGSESGKLHRYRYRWELIDLQDHRQ